MMWTPGVKPLAGRVRATERLRLRASAAGGEPGAWKIKIRIARESFAPSETITAVANRHGVSRSRLSSWRTQLREGKLVLGSSAQAGGAFAAVEMEERCSVLIEGRDVTVRLEGIADTAGIAAIAAVLTSGLR